MTKPNPSLTGLKAAAGPTPAAPAMFQGQDPLNNQGTPGGPIMSPEWSKFFDMLNAAAPGGITNKAGIPGQDTEPKFGGLSDTLSPTYNSAIDPRLHPDLVANAKLAAKGKS